MREIHLTPIPATVTLTPERSSDPEQIELICYECEIHAYAEGANLDGLVARIDEWHQQRHKEATP